MVKVSTNRFVSQRITTVRMEVEIDIQRLRERTLKNLEEIFGMAARIARGEVKHQRQDRRMVKISLNQRRRWASVAAHTAQIMNNIASRFDEQEIKAQLSELERLVNEAGAKT